jgi:starch synthase
MQYQGICSRYEMLDLLDLPSEYFTPSTLEFYGQANSLKGGLLFSDTLTTVSPSHADEITHAYYGENLEGVIRSRSSDIRGIMCGIDPTAYDPSADSRIFAKYSSATVGAEKKKNKLQLQKMFGFRQDDDIPVILIVYDELDYDKGVDLIKFVFDDIVSLGVQLVLASKGKSDCHEYFTAKAEQYADQVAYVCYNNDFWDGVNWISREGSGLFSQGRTAYEGQTGQGAAEPPETRTVVPETMAYGGSDMLLRPSRIEPCGEKHLIAMRYGVLPIVRETGGLKDIVTSYDGDTGEGNGFSFFNYNAHDMLYTINRAVDLFKNDRETWDRLVNSAMNVNVTWDSAALKYIGVYKELGETR